MIKQTAADALGMIRLRKVLSEATEPLTAVQLSNLANISVGDLRCSKYLPSMVESGEIHIAEYIRQPLGRMAAGYVYGPGENAKHPGFCKLRAAREWKVKSGYNESIRSKKLLARVAKKSPLLAVCHRDKHAINRHK